MGKLNNMGNNDSRPIILPKKALKINATNESRPKTRVNHNPLFLEFKNLKTSTLLPAFKPARLYNPDNTSEWYVEYHFLIPGTNTYHRFKERFDINRIKNIAQKRIYGVAMVEFVNKKLAEGYNPFDAKKRKGSSPVFIVAQIEKIYKEMCLDATDNAKKAYFCMKNRFTNFITENSLEKISVIQVDADIVEAFQMHLLIKKLSSKSINQTISHLGMFWDIAKKEKLVFSNPFREIKQVKKKNGATKTKDKYEPLTIDEVKKIMQYLKTTANEHEKHFIYFIALIYLAWARPLEIRRLKINQIDLDNDYIIFRKPETKNETGAYVQIVSKLKELLLEMDLSKYPPDHFLFSPGFLPGAKPVTEKIVRSMWNNVVHKKLRIDKSMYALKHTGNIEYLQNNKGTVNLKWQQAQNRHKTAEMTERYIRKLGAFFIDTSEVKLGSF